MSTEQNKALDVRYIEEVVNQGNLAAIDQLMAEDYVGHVAAMPPTNREGDKQMVAMFRRAFPDLHFTIEDQIAEGDKVVHYVTARGTHRGEFQGVPPTGKQCMITFININRFANGRIAESWACVDLLGLLQQIGAVPRLEA